MMNILKYAPFWMRRTKREGPREAPDACQGSKRRGDEIHPTSRSFSLLIMVASQYGILQMTNKIEGQDFGGMIQVWSMLRFHK